MSDCSVFGHVEYYSEERAKHIVKALYMWLVMEAVDKHCEDWILGGSLCEHRTAGSECTGQSAEWLKDTRVGVKYKLGQVQAVSATDADKGEIPLQT